MVNNLSIARKTYRPWEGVGMFIIKKCIYLNDQFRLALVKILTPEKIFKRGNVNYIPPFKYFSGVPPFKYFSGVKILTRARRNRSFKNIHFLIINMPTPYLGLYVFLAINIYIYIYVYIYIYIYIYTFLYWGLSYLVKELTAATHVKQSFSNELRTLVFDWAKV